eukprot:258242-Chlamydomonas_euryale.AAC.1
MAPSAIAGIPVRDKVGTLGVPFADGGDPQPDWGGHVGDVAAKYDKLARLPLSAFGRATGAVAYGVSQLLYRAEFCGLPEE